MKQRYRVEFRVTMDLVRWADGEDPEEAWADIVRVQEERLRRGSLFATAVKLDALWVRPCCEACHGLGYVGHNKERKDCTECQGRGMKV